MGTNNQQSFCVTFAISAQINLNMPWSKTSNYEQHIKMHLDASCDNEIKSLNEEKNIIINHALITKVLA